MGKDKCKATIHLKHLYSFVLEKIFSVFIKSKHLLHCFSCVVYSCLKAFGKKRENKTHGKISHSTVFNSVSSPGINPSNAETTFIQSMRMQRLLKTNLTLSC